jgi:hypothetical protein
MNIMNKEHSFEQMCVFCEKTVPAQHTIMYQKKKKKDLVGALPPSEP